ncbi:MAG: hypothetical protein ABI142_07425 [Bryocella sp.]
MRVLSAAEAISPAISRTKLVLFTPFRFGRTWKLAVTSYLGMASMFFMPFPLIYFLYLPAMHRHWLQVAYSVALVLATGIFCVLFFLMTRLEFAFFDILINRGVLVAPAWRKYGAQTFRWGFFKMVIGAPIALLIGFPFYRLMRPLMNFKVGAPPPPNFPFPFALFLYAFFAMMLGMLLLLLIGSLLSDFVLPSLALEDVPVGEAFRRFFLLVKQEPGAMLGFTCLKAVLGLVGYYAVMLAAEIVLIIAIIVLALAGLLIGWMLHKAGVPWMVLKVVAIVCAIPCYVGFAFYLLPMVIGSFVTFLQAWGVYFLGGRYPLLGEALDQSTPPPPQWPVPPAYPPPPAI